MISKHLLHLPQDLCRPWIPQLDPSIPSPRIRNGDCRQPRIIHVDRERFLQAGFEDYVAKPITDEAALLGAIAGCLTPS
jgi:hypothetical protein